MSNKVENLFANKINFEPVETKMCRFFIKRDKGKEFFTNEYYV